MIEKIGEPVCEADRQMQHPVETLKALPEHALRPVPVRLELDPRLVLQLPTPLIAQREGHRQHSHKFANTAALGHVGVLKLIATALQMAKEGFDATSRPIDFERLRPLEIMADDRQMGVATVAYPLRGEVNLSAGHLVQIACEALPAIALAPPGGGAAADHGVGFHPDHEGDFHQLEPREPAPADELAVHRQRADVGAWQDGEHLLHERDAVARVGIAALGAFGQNPPCDGQAHAVENDADHQDVDVGSAELPVGAIHGKNPAPGGFRGHRQHKCSDPACRQRAGSEEALESPVNRFGLGGGEGMAGEPDERHGALADDRQHQHQKARHPGLGQAKVWLEMLAEGLHSGFGGLGIVVLASHNQRLTPWAAIDDQWRLLDLGY